MCHYGFMYQAASWGQPRRVGEKDIWHWARTTGKRRIEQKIGKEAKSFMVTNLSWRCQRVVRFDNQRGPAEQWRCLPCLPAGWRRAGG